MTALLLFLLVVIERKRWEDRMKRRPNLQRFITKSRMKLLNAKKLLRILHRNKANRLLNPRNALRRSGITFHRRILILFISLNGKYALK